MTQDTTEDYPDDWIVGSKNIAKLIPYSDQYTVRTILPQMALFGLAFKKNIIRTSPWITTPYFLMIYLTVKEHFNTRDINTNNDK